MLFITKYSKITTKLECRILIHKYPVSAVHNAIDSLVRRGERLVKQEEIVTCILNYLCTIVKTFENFIDTFTIRTYIA